MYRVRWRRNNTGSGFCISNVNHCDREGEEDAETRKSCCSLLESMPFVVSRDCFDEENKDEIEKHQRRVSMSVRALKVPLSIANRVVRQYEMSNKNIKILSATFDFVKTRNQEWIMLQMKSFRLTKASRRAFSSLKETDKVMLPSMMKEEKREVKRKDVRSSRLHLTLRKCTLCKREIAHHNGPKFTMTPDMMVKMMKELRIMNTLISSSNNDGCVCVYFELDMTHLFAQDNENNPPPPRIQQVRRACLHGGKTETKISLSNESYLFNMSQFVHILERAS